MTTTLTLPDTDREASLDERIADACGQLNACHAALVDLVAEVIATDAWHGWGIRSLEHWITWRTGLSGGHARSLIALATAAQSHPKVCAAFAAGQLSIDQAALAVRARREHDDDIAVWARVMTLPQLRVAVRASNTSAADRDNTADDSDPEPTEPDVKPAPPQREYVSLQQDEDGTWRLSGSLDADHGAVVDAALGEARDRLFRDGDRDVTAADALVDIAERSLDTTTPEERRERYRINLFLDPAQSPTVTWINGIAIPDAIARLFTCDGTLSPILVTDARPGQCRTQPTHRPRPHPPHRPPPRQEMSQPAVPSHPRTRSPPHHPLARPRHHRHLQPHRSVPTLPPRPPPRPPRHHRQRRRPQRHHLPRRPRPDHRHRHPRPQTTRPATPTPPALPPPPRRTPPTLGHPIQPDTPPEHQLTTIRKPQTGSRMLTRQIVWLISGCQRRHSDQGSAVARRSGRSLRR